MRGPSVPLRRLAWPAVVVALLALALRADAILGLAVGLVGVVVWVLRRPQTALDGMEVERRHPTRVFWGEPIPVELVVRNRRRIGVSWVQLSDPLPLELGAGATRWVVHLGPGEERSLGRTLEGRRRGYHLLGPTVASTGDLLGLRRVEAHPAPATGVLVYPRILPLARLGLEAASPLAEIPSRRPLHEDPTRLIGVRPYQAGDPIRRVHWTASASQGELLVKQFEHGTSRRLTVAVDLTAGSHPHPGRRRSAEQSVTVAASVIHHCVTLEKQAVGLRIVARDAPTNRTMMVDTTPRTDDAHLMEQLEHLARARLDRDADPGPVLDARGLGFGASMLLVTGILSEAGVISLLRLRRAGVRVAVVLTGADRDRWGGVAEGEGIEVHRLTRMAAGVSL